MRKKLSKKQQEIKDRIKIFGGKKRYEKYKKAVRYLNKKEKESRRIVGLINEGRIRKISLKYIPEKKETIDRRIDNAERLKEKIKQNRNNLKKVFNEFEREKIRNSLSALFGEQGELDNVNVLMDLLSDSELKDFFNSSYGRDIERLQYANYSQGEIADINSTLRKEFNLKNIDEEQIKNFLEQWIKNNLDETRVKDIFNEYNDIVLDKNL